MILDSKSLHLQISHMGTLNHSFPPKPHLPSPVADPEGAQQAPPKKKYDYVFFFFLSHALCEEKKGSDSTREHEKPLELPGPLIKRALNPWRKGLRVLRS